MFKAEMLKLKAQFLRDIRIFFDNRNFVEVGTPVLVKNPGLEPNLVPFKTEYLPQMGGGEKIDFYLPTSPEYHLKKALAMGLDRVYEITKSFRNGEKSKTHEPEFLMLEWYRHPGNYREIANDTFELCQSLAQKYSKQPQLWSRKTDLTVEEAFQKFANVNLKELSRRKDFPPGSDFESEFNFLMVSKVEPSLKDIPGLVFLWDYPAPFAALSRKKPQDDFFAERFEVYFKGVELANAFGELTDPVEQRKRCLEDIKKREEIYGFSPPLDEDFLEALGKLSQEAGGIALGVERLLQVMTGAERIQDVIAFPHWEKL